MVDYLCQKIFYKNRNVVLYVLLRKTWDIVLLSVSKKFEMQLQHIFISSYNVGTGQTYFYDVVNKTRS